MTPTYTPTLEQCLDEYLRANAALHLDGCDPSGVLSRRIQNARMRLRAADAELARGREAEALLRRFAEGMKSDLLAEYRVRFEVRDWLAAHPAPVPAPEEKR